MDKKTTKSENIGTKMSNEDYVKVLDERLNNFQSLKIQRFS